MYSLNFFATYFFDLEQYAKYLDFNFSLVCTAFTFFAISRVPISLLLLGVFITHSGEFTRFLHRIGFAYLIYYLWMGSTGIVTRFKASPSLSSLELMQEDSLFFRLFAFYATIIVAIFFFGVAERFILSKRTAREFPILIFFLHFGGLFALRLHTLRDLLIALERVTLSSYVLATFERQNRFSTYAGVQYFLLGSLPSARLLLAFGLFYLQGGSLVIQDLDLLFGSTYNSGVHLRSNLGEHTYMLYNLIEPVVNMSQIEASNWTISSVATYGFYPIFEIENAITAVNPLSALSVMGFVFLFFNLLFKLTAAPFHVWAPSVYGKAPITSVTFLSIYSKARVLFFIFKLLNTFLHSFSFFTLIILLFCGSLSIIVGRIGAFTEKRIKRFFVYSSRGHVGFRLAGLSLSSLDGASATFHYLAVYIVSSFLRWFVLLTRGRDKTHLTHFAELKAGNSLLALIFAFLVFSMSGIPPLGGFFIKLDVLSALLDNSHFFRNYMLFLFTVASFFYYLRLIKILFFDDVKVTRSAVTISTKMATFTEIPGHVGRLWLISICFIFLGSYIFIIQKPLLVIQLELLTSLFY